jgi:hypothetical protein
MFIENRSGESVFAGRANKMLGPNFLRFASFDLAYNVKREKNYLPSDASEYTFEVTPNRCRF